MNDIISIFYFTCNNGRNVENRKGRNNEDVSRANGMSLWNSNNTSDIFEVQIKQQPNRTCRSASVRFQFSFFRVVYHRNDVALTQFLPIAGISRVASLDDSMKMSLGRYRDAKSKDKRGYSGLNARVVNTCSDCFSHPRKSAETHQASRMARTITGSICNARPRSSRVSSRERLIIS